MSKKLQTVFFGGGPVAQRTLELLKDSFEFEAIVTKPASEARMQKILPSTPVHTVSRRAELDALCQKENFKSQFGILIDFGVIVDNDAINSFPLGIINSHFSLLPELRGVDPITFSILSGQKLTGVSLMLLVRAWDEGPLLAQAPYEIAPDATTAKLTEDLIDLSARMLEEIVPEYAAGQVVSRPQEDATLLKDATPSYTHKITKEDGKIDWSKPAEVLEREIRAFVGWPSSYTSLAGRDVIITAARTAQLDGAPGTTIADKQHLYVCCGQNALEILRLKPAGKQEMSVGAFLAGYKQFL